ncbi:MAG: FtsX-like permease family protein [Planctomycetota bacterium]
MSLVRTIARRSLLTRPLRTALAMTGIAAGIAIVVGIFALDHNTVVGLASGGDEWRADIEVSPSVKVLDPRADLAEIPGVADVSAFFQSEAELGAVGVPDDDARPRVRLFALEAAAATRIGAYRVARGRGIDPSALEGEVLVGAGLAEKAKLEPGDRIVLARPRRAARKLCIEGKIQEVSNETPLPPRERVFSVAGILAREKLGRRANAEVLIVDYAVGRELFEGVRVGETFLVERDPTVDVERLESSLGASYSYEINRNVIVGEAADERAFRNGVRFAGLLAMILGLYVVFHTLSIALVERVREIATLDALGASRRQIAGIFLAEALVLAGGGTLLGLGGGLALARLLLLARITTLGVGHTIAHFVIPWGAVLPLAAVGGLVALLGSVYPVLRLGRLRTAAVLRGDDALVAEDGSMKGFRRFAALLIGVAVPALYLALAPAIGELDVTLAISLFAGGGVLALLVGLPLLAPEALAVFGTALTRPFARLFPFSGLLARRAVEERPGRLAVSVVGLAIVSAAFVALHGMTRSLAGEVRQWGDESLVDKLFITRMNAQKWPEISAALTALPEVAGVEHGSMRTYAPFLVQGVDVERLAPGGLLADPELRRRFREERGLVLSRRIAADLGYAVGSEVQIRTGRGVVESFPVIAVSDALGYIPHPDERLYGLIDSEVMRREFCVSPASVSRIGVQLAPGVDPDAALAAVRTAMREFTPRAKEWRFETGVFVRDYILFDIDRDFVVFDIILGLSALLAGIGLMNGHFLAALERTKELGILRALGASGGQIVGMVVLEAIVTGLIGGALGALLGAAMTPLVIEALRLLSGLDLPQTGVGGVVLVVVGGAVLLSIVAVLFPALRMTRIDSTRAVRE